MERMHWRKAILVLCLVVVSGPAGALLPLIISPGTTNYFAVIALIGLVCLFLGLGMIRFVWFVPAYFAICCAMLLGEAIATSDPPLSWTWDTVGFIVTYGGIASALYAPGGLGGYLIGVFGVRLIRGRSV